MNKIFKIRASQAGKIMGVRGLGKQGETVVLEWLVRQLYGYRANFSNKYTKKGIIMEDDSIDYIADQLDYGFLTKNEEYFENEFCCGTPDVILSDHIIDVKNSFTPSTFPIFDDELKNKDYFYQGQIYMNLTGRKHYKVIYTLMNTPIHLVEREARSYCYSEGLELDDNILKEFIDRHNWDNVKDEYKIKVFEFDYDPEVIEKIKERVEECRAIAEIFIEKLL